MNPSLFRGFGILAQIIKVNGKSVLLCNTEGGVLIVNIDIYQLIYLFKYLLEAYSINMPSHSWPSQIYLELY
jgi:hypothetical protein